MIKSSIKRSTFTGWLFNHTWIFKALAQGSNSNWSLCFVLNHSCVNLIVHIFIWPSLINVMWFKSCSQAEKNSSLNKAFFTQTFLLVSDPCHPHPPTVRPARHPQLPKWANCLNNVWFKERMQTTVGSHKLGHNFVSFIKQTNITDEEGVIYSNGAKSTVDSRLKILC